MPLQRGGEEVNKETLPNMETGFACPVPRDRPAHVSMAHGGGGTMMHRLIEEIFIEELGNTILEQRHDAALLSVKQEKIAFTTDSFVVKPLVFPGGDIGSMAVHGTVNDLATAGARPRFLSASFILEEGLELELLRSLVQSMRRAADESGVSIVTGDTKVIERRGGDGLFINTTGIGTIEHDLSIGPRYVNPGDAILLNGDLGRHGIAVMASREGLEFETRIESDSAPVATPVLALIEAGINIHCLRDLTRGGLASAVNEICHESGHAIHLHEDAIPVRDEVRGACEILGFDPLYVANEGRFIAFVPEQDAARALQLLQARQAQDLAQPSIIGRVLDKAASHVTIEGRIGASRILDMISGEQLPRIC